MESLTTTDELLTGQNSLVISALLEEKVECS